ETSTRTTPPASRASSSAWGGRWARTSEMIWKRPWTRLRVKTAGIWGASEAARKASRMPEGPMKGETLTGFEAGGESRWDGLLERAQHPWPFLTWQWQTAWSRAFMGGRPVQLLEVSDDAGALAGILPLYEETPGVHRLVGGVDVSDYLDLIAPAGLEEE